MRVCLIADRPDHPVLAAAMALLGERHETRVLLAADLAEPAGRDAELERPADVYLLKSRTAAAGEIGFALEAAGAVVVNRPAATAACLDRAALADGLDRAGLPQPQTASFACLGDVAAGDIEFPVMIKSRHSRRGDLVAKLGGPAELEPLRAQWADEPVIAQAFAPGDGYDVKLWAIGGHLEAARRLTPLLTGATGAAKQNLPLDAAVLPELEGLGRAVGEAFSLHLYGVDVILSGAGRSIVDVNAFPGFRGVPDAPALLAGLVEQVGAEAPIG